MSEKRRDHRGRILHNGEIQLSDGRYRFKYVDEMGKERCVYSWRLDHNDATPKGMLMCHKVTHKNLIDSSPLFRYCLTHASCNFFVKTIDSDTSKEI